MSMWGVHSFQIQKEVEFTIKELTVFTPESRVELLTFSSIQRDVNWTVLEGKQQLISYVRGKICNRPERMKKDKDMQSIGKCKFPLRGSGEWVWSLCVSSFLWAWKAVQTTVIDCRLQTILNGCLHCLPSIAWVVSWAALGSHLAMNASSDLWFFSLLWVWLDLF